MNVRAECVMLNKSDYILDALRALRIEQSETRV